MRMPLHSWIERKDAEGQAFHDLLFEKHSTSPILPTNS